MDSPQNSLNKFYYLNPQFYEEIYRDHNIRRAQFIEDLITKYVKTDSPSILDIGCGTGDVLNALKKDGRYLAGIDKSPSMLEYAGKNSSGIEYFEHDMSDFKLDRKDFDMATCLFSTFMYCTSNKQINDALERFRIHLKMGGILVLDLVNFLKILRDKSYKDLMKESYKFETFSADTVITNTLQLETQSMHSEWEWSIEEFTNDDENHKHYHIIESTTFRMFFPKEIEEFLNNHGFKLRKFYSSYDINADNLEGHRMVVVAERVS